MHKAKTHRKTKRLNIDDTDSESDDNNNETSDPSRPWLDEWNSYLGIQEVIPEDMGVVRWWGVWLQYLLFKLVYSDAILQIHGRHYPTWHSLAHDYLAIMASSVSSKSAFSAAGITISKRRNRLTGDIVEALQCLKTLIHQDLLFCDVASASQDEKDLDLTDQDPANDEADASEVIRDGEDWSWDNLVEGLEDDEGPAPPAIVL